MTAPATGRPRDARIDAAVLAATRDLVAEVGYGELSMRAIAERAGTSVPAIRRRWASKAHLVHEAVYPSERVLAPTGAGDLRSEVRAMVRRCVEIVGSPAGRRATPGLLDELMADPALEHELSNRLRDAGLATLSARLGEAVASGRARPDVDLRLCTEIVFGATLAALVLRGREAVNDAWVEALATTLTDGMRP